MRLEPTAPRADVLTAHYFCVLSWLSARTGLPQRFAKALNADFHDALVHADVGFFGGCAIVGQLKDVGFQTGSWVTISEMTLRVYHSLAQQKFQAEQGFGADGSRSEDLD